MRNIFNILSSQTTSTDSPMSPTAKSQKLAAEFICSSIVPHESAHIYAWNRIVPHCFF